MRALIATMVTTAAVVALGATAVAAQDATRSGKLFDELALMDKELFDAAFIPAVQTDFGRSLPPMQSSITTERAHRPAKPFEHSSRVLEMTE